MAKKWSSPKFLVSGRTVYATRERRGGGKTKSLALRTRQYPLVSKSSRRRVRQVLKSKGK